jgi:hypothetical protein
LPPACASSRALDRASATSKEIFGSQLEEVDGYVDRTQGGIVRVDPRTNRAVSLAAPGVLGVSALGDNLWLIVPGRRSDFVLSYSTN